jgi:hypothetical protein
MKQIMLPMIFSLLLACSFCFAQTDEPLVWADAQTETLQEKTNQGKDVSTVITEVEKALQNNSAKSLTALFTKKISLSLRGTESGMFSSNQAHYIVEEFFSRQKLTNFRFTSKGTEEEELYATGGGTIFIRGKRESVQVYVGFIKSGPTYLISQFNIY